MTRYGDGQIDETRLSCRPGMDGNYGVAGALPDEQGSLGALYLDVRVSLHINKNFQNPQKRILEVWSKWRDSNSRHPRLRRQFAVPDKIIGLTLLLDFIDRCTQNTRLHLPPAAPGVLTQSR